MKKILFLGVILVFGVLIWLIKARNLGDANLVLDSHENPSETPSVGEVADISKTPQATVDSTLNTPQSKPTLKSRLAVAGFRRGSGLRPAFYNQEQEWRFVQSLGPQDEQELLALFHEESALSNRVQYMRMMTQCGGDASAQVLTEMLKTQTGKFGSPEVDGNYYALYSCVEVLGPISTRSELARQFLREACHEEYWKLNRQYTAADYMEPHENRRITTVAIKALALGGHPEAMELINAMLQWEPLQLKLWAPYLVTARFYYEVAQRGDSVKLGFMDSSAEFETWSKTETGKEWNVWGDKYIMME
jgi:hypothetical protein